jgi:porphyrinogen peroxidase
LTTPNAQAGSPPVPQAVVQALTRAAIFLVATINSGGASGTAVRSFCGELPALLRAVGFRDIEANLSCVMGIGSDAWDRLFGQPRPSELHPFREIKAGSRHAVATPGDQVELKSNYGLRVEAARVITRLSSFVSS